MKLIGVILILVVLGFYALWIWYTKNQQGVSAKIEGEDQVFDILVKGVYSPSVIKARTGKPIKINFKRDESSACSKFINFPDFKIREELPEGKIVTVEIKSDKKGDFTFTCDMGMYKGRLIIE